MRLRRTWRAAFADFELATAVSYDLGAELNREHRPRAVELQDLKFEVLTRLHARACSLASEVYVLMSAGHASGAYARWRTMHEIAVVGHLIAMNDRELANRYLLHDRLERAKAARLHLQHQERANLEQVSPEDIAPVVALAKELIDQFGEEFGSQYGWASTVVDKKRPTFYDLELAADLDHWRPYYTMASWGVHASPKGALWNLATGHLDDVLFAGVSNAGLADPGHQSLLSLLFVTSALVTVAPSVERLVSLHLLTELVDRAGSSFLKAHQSLDGPRTIKI